MDTYQSNSKVPDLRIESKEDVFSDPGELDESPTHCKQEEAMIQNRKRIYAIRQSTPGPDQLKGLLSNLKTKNNLPTRTSTELKVNDDEPQVVYKAPIKPQLSIVTEEDAHSARNILGQISQFSRNSTGYGDQS